MGHNSACSEAKSAAIPHSIFQTDALPVEARFQTWRESVLPLFDSFPDELDASTEFSAQVESFNLGSMFFCMSAFSALRFRREKNHRADEDADHLLVQLYLVGGYEGHNGYRNVKVNAGDISLLDLGRPLETRARNSNALSLVIPRDLVFSLPGSSSLAHGSIIPAGSSMGNILGYHLLNVWQNLPSASLEELDAINRMLVATVVGAFTQESKQHEESAAATEAARLEAVRSYIQRNLDSDSLTPEHLCRHFACSRAQLYRMFAPLGGVSSYIREVRLNRCLEQLTRFGCGRQKIVDVALQWGFSNHSHFCRLFKQTFGISPSDAVEKGRMQAAVQEYKGQGAGQGRPQFHDWLCRL